MPNYKTIDSPGATDCTVEELANSGHSSSSSPSLKQNKNQSKLRFIRPYCQSKYARRKEKKKNTKLNRKFAIASHRIRSAFLHGNRTSDQVTRSSV